MSEAAVSGDESEAALSGAPANDPAESPGDEPELGRPGRPFDRKAPFLAGLLAGLGLLVALAVGKALMVISGALLEIVVALFIAAGLDPAVRWLERRGLRIYRHALERGVLLRPLGTTIYFMPPYVIEPQEIDLLASVATEGVGLACA